MRRLILVVFVLVLGVACDPVPTVPVPQVSAGSGGDAVAVTAVLSQTPGRGWRWRTEDTGVVVDQGLQYFSSSTLAEADAVRVLGSNWPGTPSENFTTVADAEEDGWHYVGETGEPAFGTGVANATGESMLAFRIRESGIVDLQGGVSVTPAATSAVLFTLPAGYRPDNGVSAPTTVVDSATGKYIAALMVISTAGNVSLLTQTSTFIGGYVAGQFFLSSPAIAP